MALGTLLQGLLVVDIPSLLDHHVPVGLYWASPESKGRRWWPPFPLVEVVPSVVEGLEQLPRVLVGAECSRIPGVCIHGCCHPPVARIFLPPGWIVPVHWLAAVEKTLDTLASYSYEQYE